MDFRILGPLEVLHEGQAIALGGSKQRALVAVLLLHANETLSTDRLIDELWGERPPSTAAKTVQVHISRLRKALAAAAGNGSDGVVITREHGYELKVDPENLDAHRFERLVSEGRSELAAGRPERAVTALEEALSLWRGPPLADLGYEPFAQNEVARLEDLRVAALEQLIEAKLALGGHEEVVGQLETLIAEQPYRERLRAQLMLALYRSDRQADALQAYQDARKQLVDELGIEPGERLRELEAAILAQDPRLGLPVARERVVDARGTVFVGRERELGELVDGLDHAFAGHGRLFLLVGEPGIGKSRLAEELLAHARARGARVLVGRSWEAGGAPAYWPWVQSLRAYVRESDGPALRSQLGAGAADLAQMVPELHERFPDLPEPPALDSEGARFRLFDATAEFLRNASADRPIVLLLDDLHAADTPSLLLLQFLARGLGSTRMLLVAAYRNVDPVPGQALTTILAELAREPVTRRLSLGGLSERELGEYVEVTASQIATPELVKALHEETEGNPLFAGEMVRLLSVEGVRPDSSTDVRLAIPQTVRDVIARRLSHLSKECNRVLVLASVIGREFALDALARLADVPQDELLDALDEAMAARVVSDVPGGADRFRFAHVLIRDTLYDGLTTARRVQLHRRAVEALEALYGEQPGSHLAELAHHALTGRDLEKAVHYAWRAGDRALELLAYEEASRLYQTALEAIDAGDVRDEEARCQLLLSLGEAHARAGNAPAAKSAFLDAVALARRLALPRELARAAARYGGRLVWARAGGDELLVPLLEEGLSALGDEDADLRVRLLARLAGALRDEHTRERRDALSREAVELARRAGSAAMLAYALDGRAAAILAPDTVEECLALASELLELAEGCADAELQCSALCHRIEAQLLLGQSHEAQADLAAAVRIAHDLRQPAHLFGAVGLEAMLALATGRFDDARVLVDRTMAWGERAQPDAALPVYALQRYALCDAGEDVEAVEASIRDVASRYPARPVFRCALLHLDAQLGRHAEAQAALDELAADGFSGVPFDKEWLLAMSFLAEACALVGDAAAAEVLYERLLPWAALDVVDQAEGIRGAVARYVGILATVTKRWDAAEAQLENAVAMNARMGFRPWLAHTQHDYARLLIARGDPGRSERARDLLAEAVATYRELGMEGSAKRALELVRSPPLPAARA